MVLGPHLEASASIVLPDDNQPSRGQMVGVIGYPGRPREDAYIQHHMENGMLPSGLPLYRDALLQFHNGHSRVLSMGFVDFVKSCSFVRHSASTLKGNSGSACFTDLRATHDVSDSSFVAGIRMIT